MNIIKYAIFGGMMVGFSAGHAVIDDGDFNSHHLGVKRAANDIQFSGKKRPQPEYPGTEMQNNNSSQTKEEVDDSEQY